MRTLISLLLLFVISAANAGEWVALIGGAGSKAALYARPSSIGDTARGATIWTLSDFNTTDMFENTGVMHRSYLQLSEYDCVNRMERVLSIKVYSGNMGEGNLVLQNDATGRWTSIPQRNVSNSVARMVCKNW